MFILTILFPILLIPYGLLICLIMFKFFNNKMKKKKQLESEGIPLDIMQDFTQAERRYEQSGGEIDTQNVLWEIYKSRSRRNISSQTESRGARIQTLPIQSVRREEFSHSSDSGITDNQRISPRAKTNNNRRLFRRR